MMERRSQLVLEGTAETPWQFIRRNKDKAGIGMALGCTIGCGAKYIAATLLILWLAAGGQ
jgi:hypothetical protein